VPLPSVALLRNAGFDVLAIAESSRGLPDRRVMDLATAESRWIITFDRDYGDLIFARYLAPPPALILSRLRSYRPEDPGKLVIDLPSQSAQFAGCFVVIEEESIRKRVLPAPAGSGKAK
jgi:predicted nuclease of predicted toxin-antitoxin system